VAAEAQPCCGRLAQQGEELAGAGQVQQGDGAG
jgi:hypothetical protein